MKKTFFSALLVTSSQAMIVISEFEPNPAGGDPATASVELSGGTPGAAFDLWLLSLENDGYAGTVDRSTNIMGTFDASGFAVATIGDLENPSFTVTLVEATNPIATGTDIDPADDGVLVIPPDWTIHDAVGVSDSVADDSVLYGAALGGADILYNGEFEPLLVFRDGTNGDWYQTVNVDFGGANEHIGTFPAAGGTEVNEAGFDASPDAPTYGMTNPSFVGVPEPSTALLSGLAMLGLLRRRR